MVSRSIEIEIDEFDDETILEAASEIMARRGGLPLEIGVHAARDVRLLAKYIAHGKTEDALLALELLVSGNRALIEAVDIGRRLPR